MLCTFCQFTVRKDGELYNIEMSRTNVHVPWLADVFFSEKSDHKGKRKWCKRLTGLAIYSRDYLPSQPEIESVLLVALERMEQPKNN